MASILGFVWVQVRSLRWADEYQRVLRLEALAIGFAAVMVVSFAAGASTPWASASRGNSSRSRPWWAC